MASASLRSRCARSCRNKVARQMSASQKAETTTCRFSWSMSQTEKARRPLADRAAMSLPPYVWLLLARKLQQTQNVNPQQSHEMPIPGGHVQDNHARFCPPPEQYGCSGRQQRKNTAQQVHAVRSSQKINEGAGGATGNVKTPVCNLRQNGQRPFQTIQPRH